MLTICVESVYGGKPPYYLPTGCDGLTLTSVHNLIFDTHPVKQSDIYYVYNGRRVSSDSYNVPMHGGVLHVIPRLPGGKGGFGSMLRAIGAQIEKTTNREACRDLSGRRLRDINEEKRLKNWISKKAEREQEAAERKRKKLEKLRSEPRHEFTDKQYEEERSKLTEEGCDAVEKGFGVSGNDAGPSAATTSVTKPVKMKKGFMFEDEELSDSSISSSEDESTGLMCKREAETQLEEESSPNKRQKIDAETTTECPSSSGDGSNSSDVANHELSDSSSVSCTKSNSVAN